MVDIADTDPRLVALLKTAGAEWGALGVAEAAAQLTDTKALVRGLQHRIELAVLGRTAPRAAEAVMAVLAEQSAFTEAQWRRERTDPEAGHTFRLQARSRGSYAHLTEDGTTSPHTDADWMPTDVEEAEDGFRIEVRAWNLRDALTKAASLPLSAWKEPGEPST